MWYIFSDNAEIRKKIKTIEEVIDIIFGVLCKENKVLYSG